MSNQRPAQVISPEQYLASKNVKQIFNKWIVAILEARPDNVEQFIFKLIQNQPRPQENVESFPSYTNPQRGLNNPTNPMTNLAPKAAGRRQSAISPDVLRKCGMGIRRQAFSSKMTSNTEFQLKVIPKDEATTKSLEETIKKVDLFSFLQDEQRTALVKAMFKMEFKDKDEIIKEGDNPDNFYIIESGNCRILKNINGENKEVATTSAGRYFGELALISGSTRTATVVADGPVVCWAIDQTTYLGLLKEQHGLKRQRYQNLLRSVPLLKPLQDYEILLVADALQPVNPKEEEIIVKQGDAGDDFFIILEGECKVRKSEGNGPEKEVGTLSSGKYFGELALMQNTTRAATVVAGPKTKLIKLDRKSFSRLLGPCNKIFADNIKTYGS